MPKSERADTGFALVSAIWPTISYEEFNVSKKHYSELIDDFHRKMVMIKDNPEFYALQSAESIIGLIRELPKSPLITQGSVVATALGYLGEEKATPDRILRSIDLAVSTWLATTVSCLDLPRPDVLVWRDDEVLDKLVESFFTEQSPSILKPDRNLTEAAPLDFTAASLVRDHGFTILWTSNLAAHLSIDWHDRVLTIYEHKIALYNHLRFAHAALPVQLLEETLDTLNLLFPFQDNPTKRLLVRHNKSFYGLGWCGRPRPGDKLTAHDFHIWRHHIDELGRAAGESPVGLQQLRLARDGNNLLSFATFWVACGAVVLSLSSIGFSIVAMVYGVLQYDLALAQYRLSLAQACMEPEGARPGLAEFCNS